MQRACRGEGGIVEVVWRSGGENGIVRGELVRDSLEVNSCARFKESVGRNSEVEVSCRHTL